MQLRLMFSGMGMSPLLAMWVPISVSLCYYYFPFCLHHLEDMALHVKYHLLWGYICKCQFLGFLFIDSKLKPCFKFQPCFSVGLKVWWPEICMYVLLLHKFYIYALARSVFSTNAPPFLQRHFRKFYGIFSIILKIASIWWNLLR